MQVNMMDCSRLMPLALFRLIKRTSIATILLLGFILPAACVPLSPAPPTPTATPLPPTLTATRVPTATATLSPTPIPTRDCLQTPGAIESGVINDKRLKKPMTYFIYLPPCYQEHTAEHYPVLYLLHGVTYSEDQWIRLGAPRAADQMIAARELPPFIIVMPYDYGIDPPTISNFGEVLADTLIPTIDSTYRTQGDRVHRALGGLSRGGGWAIHIGIRHPELFASLGGHSPAIFFSDSDTMKVRLRNIPAEQQPRFYIDIGDADNENRSAQAFADLLDQFGFEHEWHFNVGTHDERYWSAHVDEYLRWYAAGWK
jgi:enterochelin esterase-like enzyme